MASIGEFDFIDQFLKAQASLGQPFYRHPDALGIGDDCALIPALAEGEQFAVSTDMLVEGRHYYPDVDPKSLGHKVLAVNLSDLAAMGARPVAFTLAAALRSIDAPWLTAFLEGLLSLAREAQCPLVGGDTTGIPKGAPQVFSVTVMGAVPIGHALRRDGVQPGDDLWVSGSLGGPAYGLSGHMPIQKLSWPAPRVVLGQRLRGIAHAAIDISDGLQSELMHLLKSSSSLVSSHGKGLTALAADLQWEDIALAPELAQAVANGRLSLQDARVLAATGGDEYEILFSASIQQRSLIRDLSHQLGLALTRIGTVAPAKVSAVVWRDKAGQCIDPSLSARLSHGGFQHF